MSNSNTQVFGSLAEFLEREDKTVNGVSPDFNGVISDTNTGCWNCDNCENCTDSKFLTYCTDCNNCYSVSDSDSCEDCTICEECFNCHSLTDCKSCTDWHDDQDVDGSNRF